MPSEECWELIVIGVVDSLQIVNATIYFETALVICKQNLHSGAGDGHSSPANLARPIATSNSYSAGTSSAAVVKP